jgi:hypothetical protein
MNIGLEAGNTWKKNGLSQFGNGDWFLPQNVSQTICQFWRKVSSQYAWWVRQYYTAGVPQIQQKNRAWDFYEFL